RHQTSALHTALSPNLSFHSPYRAHRDLRPSPTRRSSDLFFAYSPYVPFFTNINATPASYDHAGNKVDDSAYWLQKQLEVIVEPRYHEFINEVNAFRDASQSYAVKRVDMITAIAKTKQGDAVTDFLTKRN